MPYYRVQTYTTTGTFQSWNLDSSIVPFNASVAITAAATGTAGVTLQYTLNPLNGPLETDASANWITSSLSTAITTTTLYTSFSNPISRIRVTIASINTTGVIVEMNQGLSTN